MSTSPLPITLGLMTWGAEGTSGARVHDIPTCEKMLDVFQAHGHNEVDTAIAYASGTSEEYLGKIDWLKRGIKVDTKLWPATPGHHNKANLRKYLEIQLNAVKAEQGKKQLELWYLHAPDHSVPYEETLEGVNELYLEGHFKRFGVSNFAAWEVAEIVGICERKGWVKPTAYQGIYNAIHRSVEAELIPACRKFGLSFYEFNPLGGGLFTGRFSNKENSEVEAGSRFDPNTAQGKNYRDRYFKPEYWSALELVENVAKKHNLTLPEVALRWVSHHSLLRREHGDNVLIGASSVDHLEANLVDLEKGPLPEEVVKVLDEAWKIASPVASCYFR